MREKWVSIISAFICVGFIVGATLSFTIAYQSNETILSNSDLGIYPNLKVPFHAEFPMRSYNQSIDIYLHCTNSSLDIVVLKDTEWNAWFNGENYSAYYEAINATNLMATIEISPAVASMIDIILSTNYGEAWMSVGITSHWMQYNDSTGVNSLLAATPFAILSIYYFRKRSKNDTPISGIDVS